MREIDEVIVIVPVLNCNAIIVRQGGILLINQVQIK